MKLAEALQERADLTRKVASLHARLDNNALVQEGENPAEDPNELLKELDSSLASLEELVTRINTTNCNTLVNGESLTSLISRRDALTQKIRIYRDLVVSASQAARRATRSEIKILSTIDVKATQNNIDAMSKKLRELDNLIQQTNWTTDL